MELPHCGHLSSSTMIVPQKTDSSMGLRRPATRTLSYLAKDVDYGQYTDYNQGDHEGRTDIRLAAGSITLLFAPLESPHQPVGDEAGVIEATPGAEAEEGLCDGTAVRALGQQASPAP
jgi:hypothetical protein